MNSPSYMCVHTHTHTTGITPNMQWTQAQILQHNDNCHALNGPLMVQRVPSSWASNLLAGRDYKQWKELSSVT